MGSERFKYELFKGFCGDYMAYLRKEKEIVEVDFFFGKGLDGNS